MTRNRKAEPGLIISGTELGYDPKKLVLISAVYGLRIREKLGRPTLTLIYSARYQFYNWLALISVKHKITMMNTPGGTL